MGRISPHCLPHRATPSRLLAFLTPTVDFSEPWPLIADLPEDSQVTVCFEAKEVKGTRKMGTHRVRGGGTVGQTMGQIGP